MRARVGSSLRSTQPTLIVGGRVIGVFIEKSDETTLTRYFHSDHLGSISVITKEAGPDLVVERLSYDAWGKRRHPETWQPDPSGSITSEASRGFTGHEHLDAVGLIPRPAPGQAHERAGRSLSPGRRSRARGTRCSAASARPIR